MKKDEEKMWRTRRYFNMRGVNYSGKELGRTKKMLMGVELPEKERPAARKKYFIEFVENINIIFKKEHIKILYEEFLEAEKENLERPQLIYYKTKKEDENTLTLKITNVEPYKEIVEKVGEIKREPTGLRNKKIKDYCKENSGDEKITYSHTHPKGSMFPSVSDLISYTLGMPEFITSITEEYFCLGMFRADFTPNRDKNMTLKKYLRTQTAYYRKFNYFIKDTPEKGLGGLEIQRSEIENW